MRWKIGIEIGAKKMANKWCFRWMVAPCYYLAGTIFEDAGLKCRGFREVKRKDGEQGGELDLEWLESELEKDRKEREENPVSYFCLSF